ncbi:GTP-binding protein, chloroplastic [Heracleum sosnowskyi]|uniref:GTP-binding protein, chloroplastic n=1 Tax=Heracleum sosnowskyi TaxID=360622 RepID=A0AAD8IDU5_9APIA|nr:GTP-binding protein, chloroplastic [Heracleum sosnowskyi]
MLRAIKHIRKSNSQTLINPTQLSSSSLLTSPISYSQARLRHRECKSDESNNTNSDPNAPPKLFVVQPKLRPDNVLKLKLEEALNLANSLEEQRDGDYDTQFSDKDLPSHLVVQNPAARTTRADTYFGLGTVNTVKCHLNAADSGDGFDAVFVNAILSGVQQRNLEQAWGKPVLDRVSLIIEIFHAHAQTKEAKLQAELAALMYKRSRLVRVRGPGGRYTFGGEVEVVSARGRGSGGRGFISGAGETELQLQRRRIIERRNQLLSEIKEVRRTRALQRASRKRHGGSDGRDMATIAVVGYTNAGKSTLVSALSDTYLYSDDRLFATVDPKLRSVVLIFFDPKLRSVVLPSGRKVLLSDTVGFISELPVQLVEAFHATLEEVVEADLLVHVLDSSAPNLDEHRKTVMQVLEQLGVSKDKLQNMVEVWNKIDIGEEQIDGDETTVGEDVEFEHLSEEDQNDNNNVDVEELSQGDDEGDYTDGWLASEDVQATLSDNDGSSLGCKNTDDVEESSCMTSDHGSQCQPVNAGPHVKTSALTGVGLQELLELIDERLGVQNVVHRNVFNSKWRPPDADEAVAAAEQ